MLPAMIDHLFSFAIDVANFYLGKCIAYFDAIIISVVHLLSLIYFHVENFVLQRYIHSFPPFH